MDIFILFMAIVILVGLLLAYVLIEPKKYREAVEKSFPPISDAEFVARCTPGTHPQVALKVRKIVADNLGVEYARLYPSTRFLEDIGAE
jgi:hypothetical protein